MGTAILVRTYDIRNPRAAFAGQPDYNEPIGNQRHHAAQSGVVLESIYR
jgi:hypothetical protein